MLAVSARLPSFSRRLTKNTMTDTMHSASAGAHSTGQCVRQARPKQVQPVCCTALHTAVLHDHSSCCSYTSALQLQLATSRYQAVLINPLKPCCMNSQCTSHTCAVLLQAGDGRSPGIERGDQDTPCCACGFTSMSKRLWMQRAAGQTCRDGAVTAVTPATAAAEAHLCRCTL